MGLDVVDCRIDEFRVNIDVFEGVHVVSLEVALEFDIIKHSVAVGVVVVMGWVRGKYRLWRTILCWVCRRSRCWRLAPGTAGLLSVTSVYTCVLLLLSRSRQSHQFVHPLLKFCFQGLCSFYLLELPTFLSTDLVFANFSFPLSCPALSSSRSSFYYAISSSNANYIFSSRIRMFAFRRPRTLSVGSLFFFSFSKRGSVRMFSRWVSGLGEEG